MAGGEDAVVRAVLADYRTAAISGKLRALLGFLEKLTLRPAEVSPADMAPLREAGLSDEEIEDGIHVCSIFNTINRVADAFGFDLPSREAHDIGARHLLKAGYL
jgi:uncharacterized peroxidase-related enzyme